MASPCTAPFMATALGYALTQPWWLALSVFGGLGLGMALPVLMLSYLPQLGQWLPKPGAWMETFKQALAFPPLPDRYLVTVGTRSPVRRRYYQPGHLGLLTDLIFILACQSNSAIQALGRIRRINTGGGDQLADQSNASDE